MMTFALLAAGCGLQGVRRTPARLQVVSDPPSARILVNDRLVGTGETLAEAPHETRPGSYRITVEASGYFPHDLELELPAGTTTMQISLRPIPE